MEKNKQDIVSGIVFAAFDAVYLYFCGDITPFTGKGSTPLTNQFMPYFWGSLMMILSIALIIRGIKGRKKQSKERKAENEKRPFFSAVWDGIKENREVILSFAALFLYIAFLKKIGFLIMTFLFVVTEILILTQKEKRNYIAAVITGAVASVLLYFVFGKMLHILLPTGILHF